MIRGIQKKIGALLCAPFLMQALSCAAGPAVSISKPIREAAHLGQDRDLSASASLVRPGFMRVDILEKNMEGCGLTIYIDGKIPDRGVLEIRCLPQEGGAAPEGNTAVQIVDDVAQGSPNAVISFKVALTDVSLDLRPGDKSYNSACFIGLFPDRQQMHGCFRAVGVAPADEGRGRALKR